MHILKKHIIVLITAILCCVLGYGVVSTQSVSAQESVQDTPFGDRPEELDLEGAYHLPAVYSQNLVTQLAEDELTGSFSLTNQGDEFMSNLQYRIEIYSENSELLFARLNAIDLPSLLPGEVQQMTFREILPALPDGQYIARVQVLLGRSRMLGWADSPIVVSGLTETPYIASYGALVHLPEYDERVAALTGPNVDPESKFSLILAAYNGSESDINATPVLNVHRMDASNTFVERRTFDAISTPIGDSLVEVAMTAQTDPGVYVGSLTLEQDGKTISSIGEYRWVVRGMAADIISARILNTASRKGDTQYVRVEHVGPADAETTGRGLLEVAISDANGVAGFIRVPNLPLSDGVGKGTAKLQLQRDLVSDAELQVTILDDQEHQLAYSTSAIRLSTEISTQPLWKLNLTWYTHFSALLRYLAFAALILTALWCLYYVRRATTELTPMHIRVVNAGMLVLMLFNSIQPAFAFGGSNGLEVQSPITVGNNVNFISGNPAAYQAYWGPIYSSPIVALFVNSPTHNSTVDCRSPISLSLRIEFAACNNIVAGGRVIARYDANGIHQTTLEGSGANWIKVYDEVYEQSPNCPSATACIHTRNFSTTVNLSSLSATATRTTLQVVVKHNAFIDASHPVPDDVISSSEIYFVRNFAQAFNIHLNCAPECGNTVVETGEQCDDGNSNNTDACTNTCSNPVCGDSYVRSGVEQCDDGNTTGGDGCSSTCQNEFCGNGYIDPGEVCDDGNMVSGDGCSDICNPESCGNGFLDPGEACDDGNAVNTDTCTNQCTAALCGDSYVHLGVEQCDDGNLLSGDGCNNVCHIEICGNATLDPGEQCDDGNTSGGDGCSSTCFIEREADVYIAKSGPPTAVRGNTLYYSITAANLGPNTAENVVIADQIPAGLTFDSLNSSPNCVRLGTSLLCNNFSLTAGESRVFTIAFTVPTSYTCGGTIQNTAIVATSSTDPNSANNLSQVVSTTVDCPPAVLTISKTDGRTTAAPNEVLNYTVTVTNTSIVDATNVVVQDTLPFYVGFVSADNGGTHSNGLVTWPVVNIPAGQSVVYTVVTQISTFAPSGTVLSNYVEVVGGPNDTDTTTVVIIQTTGCIEIIKETFNTNSIPITPVAQFTFKLNGGVATVTNDSTGHARFENVATGTHSVSEITPPTWELLSTTPSNGVLSVQPGPNCAVVLFKNRQNITQVPVLTIAKSDGRTTVVPGQTLSYTITVTNTSTVDATNVTVTDSLPASTTFTAADNGGSHSTGNVTWTGLAIPAQQSLTLTLQVVVATAVSNGQVLYNTATIVGGESSTDTTTITIAPPPNNGCIEIVKETFNTLNQPITPVAQFSFLLDGGVQTVTNDALGRATFSNVTPGAHTISEIIPSDWQLLSITPSNGSVNVPSGTTCATVLFKNSQNITQQPSLTISKSDGRSTASPGESLTYTINVANTSSVSASGAVVTDTLPSTLTFVSASDAGTVNGQVVTWNLSTIGAQQTRVLTLNAIVSASANNGAVISNTATIQNGPSSTDTTAITRTLQPLTISKTDNKSNAVQGETLTYTIILTNPDSAQATNVMVTDTLPSGLSFSSASDGASANGQVVTWSNISVNGNSSRTLSVSAVVSNSSVVGSVLTNIAQITGGNSAQDSTTINGGTADPNNITIDITDDKDPVEEEESFCYTIRITNLNSVELLDQTLTQTLDGNTEFQSSNEGGRHNNSIITWDDVDLAANGTQIYTTCVKVNDDVDNDDDLLRSRVYINSATASETTRVDGNGGSNNNNDDEICRVTSITDNPDPAQQGETITYSIRIRNDSNDNEQVDVYAFLDDDLEFLSASQSGDEVGSSEVEWTNINLNEDQSETLRITAKVKNTARNGDNLRLRVRCEDDEASETTQINGTATPGDGTVRISVDKRANRQEAGPNDSVTYTITVRNLTSYDAGNLTIEDRFSAGSISIEDAGGGQVVGNGINWNLSSLSANSSQVYSYRTRVGTDMRHGQIISNTVTVTGDDLDRPSSDVEQVRIITQLPQTGIAGFIGSWKGTQANLRPTSISQSSSTADTQAATAFIVWTSIIAIGMTLGSVMGKRFFF